jgi:hypothetical protein
MIELHLGHGVQFTIDLEHVSLTSRLCKGKDERKEKAQQEHLVERMVVERGEEGRRSPSGMHEIFILQTMDSVLLSLPTKGKSLPKKESRVDGRVNEIT